MWKPSCSFPRMCPQCPVDMAAFYSDRQFFNAFIHLACLSVHFQNADGKIRLNNKSTAVLKHLEWLLALRYCFKVIENYKSIWWDMQRKKKCNLRSSDGITGVGPKWHFRHPQDIAEFEVRYKVGLLKFISHSELVLWTCEGYVPRRSTRDFVFVAGPVSEDPAASLVSVKGAVLRRLSAQRQSNRQHQHWISGGNSSPSKYTAPTQTAFKM